MKMLILMLFLQGGYIAEGQTTRVIPFVRVGDDVVIANDQPNTQTIQVSFQTIRHSLLLQPYEIVRFRSPETGYVLLKSDKTDFTSYSVVQNAHLQGVLLNTQSRGFAANKDTGLVVANPWDAPVSVTVWAYDGKGASVSTIVELAPGALWAGFVALQFKSLTGTFYIKVLSTRPLAVAAANCRVDCAAMPVRNFGVMESARWQ